MSPLTEHHDADTCRICQLYGAPKDERDAFEQERRETVGAK